MKNQESKQEQFGAMLDKMSDESKKSLMLIMQGMYIAQMDDQTKEVS